MVRYIVITSLVVLVGASACPAGQNSAGKLAMHLVASDQILGCEDLLPASCEDIDGDLSAAELAASSGYGYLAFVAYDVTSVKGVEFAVEGFSPWVEAVHRFRGPTGAPRAVSRWGTSWTGAAS